MTTAAELNAAIAKGFKYEEDDEELDFDFSLAVQDECDVFVPGFGKLEWTDCFRDKAEPDTYVFLYTHEGLTYAVYGYYDSWNGTSLDDTTLYPVEEKTRTETYWARRKEG